MFNLFDLIDYLIDFISLNFLINLIELIQFNSWFDLINYNIN